MIIEILHRYLQVLFQLANEKFQTNAVHMNKFFSMLESSFQPKEKKKEYQKRQRQSNNNETVRTQKSDEDRDSLFGDSVFGQMLNDE
jgi:hypothetical protein